MSVRQTTPQKCITEFQNNILKWFNNKQRLQSLIKGAKQNTILSVRHILTKEENGDLPVRKSFKAIYTSPSKGKHKKIFLVKYFILRETVDYFKQNFKAVPKAYGSKNVVENCIVNED